MDDMEYLTHSSDKTTPRFGLKLDSLFTNCRPLFNSSPTLRSHPVIKERIQTLRKALSQFSKIADEAASTPTTPPSSPVIYTPCSHDKPKMAPLNLDILKFTGDPLQWESFELRLKSLLNHRADGYSDIDKFAIITQAIVPAQGKTLVNDKMKEGASVPDLLSALRQTNGQLQSSLVPKKRQVFSASPSPSTWIPLSQNFSLHSGAGSLRSTFSQGSSHGFADSLTIPRKTLSRLHPTYSLLRKSKMPKFYSSYSLNSSLTLKFSPLSSHTKLFQSLTLSLSSSSF